MYVILIIIDVFVFRMMYAKTCGSRANQSNKKNTNTSTRRKTMMR